MVLVHFEEYIQKGSDNPLKYENDDNNQPIKPIGTWISQNVVLVSDSSAVEEIEDLHHHKRRKDKREMTWVDLVPLIVSYVVIISGKCIKHATGDCAFSLTHEIFCFKVTSNHWIKFISVFWYELLAEKQ